MTGARQQALAARAAGDRERAVTFWLEALDAAPDDWEAALEFKRDLRALGRYPDSEARFRRAAHGLPDAEWVAHYGSLYAFHESDLAALAARAEAMLASRPADPRVLAILGEVRAQRREWREAAAAFAQAESLDGRPEYGLARKRAEMYGRIDVPGGDGLALAFVNLDRNAERQAALRRQFSAWDGPLRRQAGVEGARLPAAAIHRLRGDPAMRGTLGCFLSHAAAWETMIAQGFDACLFLEDDVIPLVQRPPHLASLHVPAGFDLLFVNERMAPRLDPAEVSGFTVHTLASAMAAFPPDENAPGADGYVLSRAGAAKLLTWVAEDGFSDDVDWRLIAYGLSRAEIAALPRPSHAGPWLDRVSRVVGRAERLAAYVLHPAVIQTVGVDSEREDENRRGPGGGP